MLRKTAFLLFVLGIAGLVAGCGSDTQPTAGSPQAGSTETDKVKESLAQLSPEDQKATRAQKICPVTDKALGWMGKPAKVSLDGQVVFICCPNCEESLRADAAELPEEVGQELAAKPSEEEVKISEALAELSPKNQKAAKAQKNCPVTGKPLGSMGVPKKVSVKGRDVFVCCPGCIDTLKKDADTYLKKLGKTNDEQ